MIFIYTVLVKVCFLISNLLSTGTLEFHIDFILFYFFNLELFLFQEISLVLLISLYGKKSKYFTLYLSPLLLLLRLRLAGRPRPLDR